MTNNITNSTLKQILKLTEKSFESSNKNNQIAQIKARMVEK